MCVLFQKRDDAFAITEDDLVKISQKLREVKLFVAFVTEGYDSESVRAQFSQYMKMKSIEEHYYLD